MHICDRDDCNPRVVNGPQIKCSNCERPSYLACHGIQKCGNNGFKFTLPSGLTIGFLPSAVAVTCGRCDSVLLTDPINDMEKNLNFNSNMAPEAMQTDQNNALSFNIYDDITVIRESIEVMKNNMEKSTLNLTNAILSVSNRCASIENLNHSNISCSSSGKPSFVDVVKAQQIQQHQRIGTKRRLDQMLSHSDQSNQSEVQMGKVGKRTDGGLAVVPAKPKQINKFDRSLYVSRLANSVTPEKMIDYIIQNTGMKSDEFKCSLLVKRDIDVNSLAYVSYKIDVNDANFDSLSNEELWPEGAFIRPFVPKKRSLGDFVDLSGADSLQQPNKMQKPGSPGSLHLLDDFLPPKND